MGKDKDEKLEEILRLLRRLLSKREKSYKPKANYRPIPRPRVSGYQPMSNYQHYPVYRSISGKELKHNSEPKRTSYTIPKPWSEPLQYRPKERLVYDPEVRRLLQKIESYLRPEQDAEASKPENEPESFYRQLEAEEAGALEQEEKRIETGLENKQEKEGIGVAVEPEIEKEEATENSAQSDVGVEGSFQEIEQGLSNLEISSEVKESEPYEGLSEPELDVKAIKQIESQDLSSLEAELYQEPLEPIEMSEPEVKPIEHELSLEAKPKKVRAELTEEPSEGYGY